MPAAVRVIDSVADMSDWDQASFADGQVAVWDATRQVFVGATMTGGGGGSDVHFVHNQGVPSTEWTITHNLGKFPSVSVVDSARTMVEGDVRYVNANTLVLTFSSPFAGTAYLN